MNKTETEDDLENRKENPENKKADVASEQHSNEELKQEDDAGIQAEAEAGAESPDPADKLKEELEGAKDKYIRLYSEFENFRKRTAKEKLELIQSANEQLIKSLLPVVDDFERAENAFPDKNDKDLAGFFLIHSKLKKVLDLYGVKAMDAKEGSEFNADFHEAISQVQAPVEELKGKIIDVVEKGYSLNDKVIRYAKVVVGN